MKHKSVWSVKQGKKGGILTRNYLVGEEMKEIGGQWMGSQQQEEVSDHGKTDGHRDR